MRHSAARLTDPLDAERFAEDLRKSLSQTPRRIPSRYLYDALGSALFEAIGRLPWYWITRSEQRLMRDHRDAILARVSPLSRLIELGPGNGEKLATLIASPARRTVTTHLVDVSEAALESATLVLSRIPGIEVVAHEAEYEAGLAELAREPHPAGRSLALFLGSNIGNFDPDEADALLASIRAALAPGDALLLGTDLVKSERDLALAYDDPLGITAAFNKNLLVRANRELGAEFDLTGFSHRAVWNAPESRVEMRLVSERRQRVRIPAASLGITFEVGDSIWTESSYKYRLEDVRAMVGRAGFAVAEYWQERSFALTLAEAR